jgi:two-component system CheB/CheR fusion protein
VVGIGASAGGLEALQQLVGQLTPTGAVSYVVAQHLSPDHPSLIVDLLACATTLPVVVAAEGDSLAAGVIVVGPPNRDLRVEGDRLRLLDPEPRFAPSPCIDLLFESIAEHWGENGVAVVLSGTGSDGARGLLSVRACGGLTLVQAPETARFDGMPRSAIHLGGADLVLDPAAIGKLLASRVADGGEWMARAVQEEALPLTPILQGLRQLCGIDFSQYKDSTLQRQLRRRMAIRQVVDLDAYRELLFHDPKEPAALVRNLLVTVTSFFRDPAAFDCLAARLRDDLHQRGDRSSLRVWVPGCATGEEAYSIAMLVSQVLGHPADLASRVRIFATDLDEASLAIARRGEYPLSAATAIPPELRERFVTVGPDGITVSKGLRSCVVFARHNVGEDPSFPSLDLISCRNTLIYFKPALHDRVLDLFRFALQPGGLLLLGSSESLGSNTLGFAPVDAAQHLYGRISDEVRPARSPATGPLALRFSPPGRQPVVRSSLLPEAVPEQHLALLEALVRTLARPSLVLDEHHELLQVIGDVSPYCRIPEGRITAAATALLRPELQGEARALFLMVRADGQTVISRPLTLADGGWGLRLEARPLALGDRSLLLLSFVPQDAEVSKPGAAGEALPRVLGERDGSFDSTIERLERELLTSQDDLRRSLIELEQANEELEASSEELQASSEELQSSNEELEASNEELQATNDELASLNQQLRSRGEQLEGLNNELENIQTSLSQGMVILDGQLLIRRFSPLAVRVFGLVEADIGQPLLGVPTTVPLPDLSGAIRAVLAGEASRRAFEAASGEMAYLVQVLPFQERDGRRCGVIVTLTEVSELVALRRVAEASLAEFASLTDALEEVVWKRDRAMERLLYVSQRVQTLTGWTPEELTHQPHHLDALVHPDDRPRLVACRDLDRGSWSVDYRIGCRDGAYRWLRESARLLEEGDESFVVGTLTDLTSQRDLEERSRDLEAVFEAVFNTGRWGVALFDDQGRLELANRRFCDLVERDPGGIVGLACTELEADPSGGLCAALREVLVLGAAEGVVRSLELRTAQGGLLPVVAEIRAVAREAASARALLLVQAEGTTVPQIRSQKVK